MGEWKVRFIEPVRGRGGATNATTRVTGAHREPRLVPLLVGLAALLPGSVSGTESDCFGAADALARQDWQEARMLLESRLASPGCREHEFNLRYSLGYVLERSGEWCDAGEVYTRVMHGSSDSTIREAAARAVERMAQRCAYLTAVEQPTEVEPDWSATAVGVLSSGAVALIAGGALLVAAADAEDERSAAKAAMRLHHGYADVEGFASARKRFEEADDDTAAFGVAGYVGLGLGVTLALVGGGLLITDAVQISAGSDQLVLNVRF